MKIFIKSVYGALDESLQENGLRSTRCERGPHLPYGYWIIYRYILPWTNILVLESLRVIYRELHKLS